MKINFINNKTSQNFNGIYRVNINHPVPNKTASSLRDGIVAFWARQSVNRDEVRNQLLHYFHSVKKTDKEDIPFYITLNIDDDCDYNFEDSMNFCAQTFEKLA